MDKRRKKWLLFSSVFLLLAAIGIAYAWFMQNASMTTLLAIQPPDTITISDADGSDMTELDLDYREEIDKKDADGTIHIFRPVCIKSTSPIHQLEIVHTTNLQSLEFKIYPATKKSETSFQYDPDKWLQGKYVNENGAGSKTAREETLENYASIEDVKNTHAYPLYWLAENCAFKNVIQEGWQEKWQEVTSYPQEEFDVVTKTDKTFYYTYYYLEISWLENTKETDLFYIMARNIA